MVCLSVWHGEKICIVFSFVYSLYNTYWVHVYETGNSLFFDFDFLSVTVTGVCECSFPLHVSASVRYRYRCLLVSVPVTGVC